MALPEMLAELHKQYLVEYAYATSDTASKLGCYRTGCYFVSKLVDMDKPRLVASSHGYQSKAEAQAIADILSTGGQQ